MSTTEREQATCNFFRNDRYVFENSEALCDAHFDKSLCWYNVTRGDTRYRTCPFKFCLSKVGCADVAATLRVQRTCFENGTWGEPLYNGCIQVLTEHKECIAGFCQRCPDPLRDFVMNMSLFLSVLSVLLMVVALILFCSFNSIQCRRLSIHKNLAAAFVFRFALLAIWNVANTSNQFYDCTHFHSVPRIDLEWICKGLLWLVIYFQVASVIWMVIEGGYLYSRFTVYAMRSCEPPFWMFLLGGWGAPFCIVMVWTIIHQYQTKFVANSFCWLPYAKGIDMWILAGTMGAAILVNCLFLLGIVAILVQKFRSENTAESKKIWRTIKATLLLVPLLGVSNIPLFYEPDHPSGAYMLISAILQHSQGIFVAVLYCFLNSEIQNAVRRKLGNWRCRWLQNRDFETQRTYVPETGIVNKRHGIPMEQLEGVSDSHSQKSTKGEASTN